MNYLPLVWDGTAYTRPLHPIELSVYQSLTPLSTANMTLPEYEEIDLLELVKITTPDGKAEIYRVASVSTDAGTNEKNVYLEHCACILGDYMISEDEKQKGSISAILNTCLSYQGTNGRWTAGTVTPQTVIYAEMGGLSVLDAINEMMTQIPDYQCVFSGGESGWHIDIVARPTTPVCEARLSRNIEGCEISYSAQGLCTRLVGSTIPGGAMDSENITEMGVHEETMMLNDNLSDAQKITIASAYLAAHSVPQVSVSISGIELSRVTGLRIDQFDVGSVCRVSLPWMNTTIDEVIVDKRYGDLINEPDNVTFTLANATPDLSIVVAQAKKAGSSGMRAAAAAEEKVEEEHKRYETKFEQTDQYFRLLATDSEWQQMGKNWEQNITAYSQIVQTSDNIQSVVAQTGTTILAKPFDRTKQYYQNDVVLKNGIPYRFIVDHLGDWNDNDVIEIKTLVSQIDQASDRISMVVSEAGVGWENYDSAKTYHPGDRVYYNGTMYICTKLHQPGQNPAESSDFKVSPSLQSQIEQNATDISAKVSQGDLAGYMTISAMQTAFGNSAVANDGTITKAEFSTSVVDGVAKAGITADKIELDATNKITLGDKIQISQGQMHVLMPMGIGTTDTSGGIVSINNGKVTAQNFDVRIGGALKFTTGPSSYYDLTSSVVAGMVKDASLDTSTNTLTLTKFDGTVINFSKAATPVTLTGLWSGSTYTATPSSGNSVSTTVSLKTVSDLVITSTDSQIQDHGKFVTASGTITIRATTGNLDGQGNPEYVDVLTAPFSGRDITQAYNEGWEAGNTAPSTTTVTGSWSGGTYTATAIPQNVQAETSLYGIVLNGSITKNTVIPKAINVPLKVVYDDGDPQTDAEDKPSTGFAESISIDASLIYTDGQNSVSATFGTYSGTPGQATELSAGAYEFKITKDGTTTEQTFYTVPAAPSPIVPKVSKGTWQNGSIVFTAGTSGDATSTVKIWEGASTGTLDSQTNPTKVSFSVFEDVNGTAVDTGADIYATITATPATLDLGSFNTAQSKFTVRRSSGGTVNVGGSTAIQTGVTPLDIPVVKGTAQPNEPRWNESAHTYTITADGSFTVGGQSITQTQGFIDGGFAPSDAIEYGKNIAKGISAITLSLINETGYNQAGYEEYKVVNDGYYILTATPVEGSKVYRKFHVPASGGPMRYATGLTDKIILSSSDTDSAVTKTGLRATYTDGNSDAEGAGQVSVTIDASAVYLAGQAAAEAGNVDVVKGTWSSGKCTFSPASGLGHTASVVLGLQSITPKEVIIIAREQMGQPPIATWNIIDSGGETGASHKAYIQFNSTHAFITTDERTPTYGVNIMSRKELPAGSASRSVTQLSQVVLSADHTSSTPYTVDVTYSEGTPGTATITVDASAISGGGGSSDRTVTSITPNPIVLTSSQKETSNHTMTAYYTTGSNSTVALSVDASAVYQQGRTDGAGQIVMGTITGVEKYLIDQKMQEYDEEKKRYTVHVQVNGTNIENAPYKYPELYVPATSAYNHGFRDGSVGFEQATVTLQGQRVRVYTRGNSVAIKKQPSSGTTVKPVAPGSEKKFRYYNEVEMFTKNADGTYTSRGKHKWWYEDSSRGTSYYLGQSEKTYYAEGTTETYWLGGTAYYYEQGTTDTTTYYKKSTQPEGGTT